MYGWYNVLLMTTKELSLGLTGPADFRVRLQSLLLLVFFSDMESSIVFKVGFPVELTHQVYLYCNQLEPLDDMQVNPTLLMLHLLLKRVNSYANMNFVFYM